MSNRNGTAHPMLSRRPVRGSKTPTGDPNPLRRLAALYAAQALADYYWPTANLEPDERDSAIEFVESRVGQEIILTLGIPITRIRQILGEVAHDL